MTVSRRDAATGAEIVDTTGTSNIRNFDATYDPASRAMTSITTQREDGATRTVRTTYAEFRWMLGCWPKPGSTAMVYVSIRHSS
jgi:hypothetical protein